MKKAVFFGLIALALSFKAWALDSEDADQVILNWISSENFVNSTVSYPYNNAKYEIRVICNPKGELIWANGLDEPEQWSLAITSKHNIPLDLEWRLKDLIAESLSGNQNCLIDLWSIRKYPSSIYASMHPIPVAERYDDPRFDAQIKELFTSTEWTNQVFHYRLRENYYHVRMIHNPQGSTRRAVREFDLSGHTKPVALTVTWDNKYGILVDKEAPQELISHLSSLVPTSWWDWYLNFAVYNGTIVEYKEYQYFGSTTITTTWSTIPWFEYMDDLRP